MRAILKLLLAPFSRLMDGFYSSNADSCEYLMRLRAVPDREWREVRRSA
jgi:hypothetical protein